MKCFRLRIFTILLGGFITWSSPLRAQLWELAPRSIPESASMWELGLHIGSCTALGDVGAKAGISGGIHMRKALDYLFSVRGELAAARFRNSDTHNGSVHTAYRSAGLQLLIALNNFDWQHRGPRKFHFYSAIGGGVCHFNVSVEQRSSIDLQPRKHTSSFATAGLGMAVRLSRRMNLAAETTASMYFGKASDALDGVVRNHRDIAVVPTLQLNINLGNATRRREPLYWVSPLDEVIDRVSEAVKPPSPHLEDSDHDGVADEFDIDPNTPPGVPVDTRGRPLDSDGDGLPDHLDPDPYVPAPLSEERIREIARQEALKIIDSLALPPVDVVNTFLPSIHFDTDSDNIRYADYPHLATVARMMKRYPSMRLVVTGYADRTASRRYNLLLSWRRAKAVIDYLVHIHGIAPDRFILHYSGEDAPLVPSDGPSLLNRRVEFRVAQPGEVSMPPPK